MIQTLQALPFLHWLEEARTPFVTLFMSIITHFGQEVLPVAVICICYWCVNKKIGYKLMLAFFASGVSVQTLKMTFRIERPWILDPTIKPVESALGAATGYSFPSGHTQASTSLFASLALILKKWYFKLGCILLFVTVAFSRLYLGVHTLFDVSVAMLVTLFFVLLVHFIQKKIPESSKTDFIIAISMFIICLAVLIYAGYLYFNGIIVYDLIKDAFKTAGSGMGLAIGYYAERTYIKFNVKTKSKWLQIVKIVIGIGSALGLKALLKVICGENIYSDAGRYLFLVLYIVAIYPLSFRKFFSTEK